MEIIDTDTAPATRVEDRVLQWIIGERGQAASDRCAACVVRFAPGASAKPPHAHPDCEEAIFVLAGTGEMALAGGERRPVKAGDCLLMRAGEVHLLRNTGETPMKAVCFYSAPTDTSRYDFHDQSAVEGPGNPEGR